MTRFSRLFCLSALIGGLVACHAPSPPVVAVSASAVAAHDSLARLVDRYWDEYAPRNPFYPTAEVGDRFGNAIGNPVAPQYLADALAIERRYLADLMAVPRVSLDAQDTLTFELFRRDRELAIESFTYPIELMPVNPVDGVPQRFAILASGSAAYLPTTARDYEEWLARADDFASWTTQAIANMREGMRRGYTLPRALVERTLPMLAALSEDSPRSGFYAPQREFPKSMSAAERERLSRAMDAAVKENILPSYQRLFDFFKKDYLPRARDSEGLWALPLGDAWYGYAIKRSVGSGQSAAQLHAFGLAEVEKIRGRMQALLSDVAFPGTMQDYLVAMRNDPRLSYADRDALLAAYADVKAQVMVAAATAFPAMPPPDFEIRAVEPFREATAPAVAFVRAEAYQRSPAVLYVNSAELAARPATAPVVHYLREAFPGHLLAFGLQQRNTELPRFRRFGGSPGFVAGWGSYAMSLGDELGVYRDPQIKFVALAEQLSCAAEVVVDTALHSLRWTRQQALDYLRSQTPQDERADIDMVDRAIAFPGQGLACTVGAARIQALRVRAQQTLGARFDLLAFHTELLKQGAMPLDILEIKMRRWMEAAAKLD